MWKYVTRGIRETLERRANCRTNVYSQSSQDGNPQSEVKTNLTCCYKSYTPDFSAANGFCGSTKSSGTGDKRNESKWNAKHAWTEAIGWSSVIALGWVVCQSLCLHRKFCFEKERNRCSRPKILELSKAHISHLLRLQPNYILPVTSCIGNSTRKHIQDDKEAVWKAQKPFGPITVEEALEEAGNEFADTHNAVMGEFELLYGIKALNEKRYKDAVNHFSTGAKLSSAGSMFNLGVCYELGIGTLVDQTKAAKYYNKAAEHGHADAAYNLGVFYAQGRGGLPVNVDMARTYFTKAANMGQTQAQHALALEESYLRVHSDNNLSLNQVESNRSNNILKLVRYSKDKGTSYNTTSYSSEDIESNRSRKETRTMNDVRNPTETFLDFLGLNDPKPVPVIVESEI